jgi:hypothetical protein
MQFSILYLMFLEEVVHRKWLWEGAELEVFPPLMECQSSHSGGVDAIRKEMLAIDQEQLARVMDNCKRRIENRIQEDGLHVN